MIVSYILLVGAVEFPYLTEEKQELLKDTASCYVSIQLWMSETPRSAY